MHTQTDITLKDSVIIDISIDGFVDRIEKLENLQQRFTDMEADLIKKFAGVKMDNSNVLARIKALEDDHVTMERI